ncbi:MAG TPA: hypothetical protein VJT09_12650 [Pyrinomonadaceae bacterium]|nr:hypothetical protein [Pyrinomonadaceae bacterium]
MTDAVVLLRLRRFLLTVSAMLFCGTVVELWLVGHDETIVQLIPFALCGLGLLIVVAVLLRPRRAVLMPLRACMGLILLGSLFGIYQHIAGNVEFQREVNPNATGREVLMGAVGGGNPLLAPGVLALAAVLAMAATYQHPALGEGSANS